MVDIGSAVAAAVAAFVAGGVPATADPRNINPPCVLVGPPDVNYRFGKGCELAFTATVVGPNIGAPDALSVLSPVLEAARLLVTAATAIAVDVPQTDGSAPRPGYQLRWTALVPNGRI